MAGEKAGHVGGRLNAKPQSVGFSSGANYCPWMLREMFLLKDQDGV